MRKTVVAVLVVALALVGAIVYAQVGAHTPNKLPKTLMIGGQTTDSIVSEVGAAAIYIAGKLGVNVASPSKQLEVAWSTANSSGTGTGVVFTATHADSSTAASADVVFVRTDTSVGSGAQRFLSLQKPSGTEIYGVNQNGIELYKVGADVASATTIVPTGSICHVTGTTNVVNITPPASCVSGCVITLIPDGLWSTTNAGNIAIATTAVVSKALRMTYDGNTSKWYPSY